MATIYLIRHGQAQFGMEDYDVLSPTGIEQAKYLGQILKQRNIEIHKVFSGNMKRHLQTANHSLENFDFDQSKINFTNDWNEFDHRNIIAKYDERYEDMNNLKMDIFSSPNPKQKIEEVLKGAVTRWTSEQFNDYNESWSAFTKRIENGLQHIAATAEKNENILVYTSGGSISVALKKLLDLSVEKTFELQLYTANASITKIKTTSRGLQLISFNDHAHFEGDKKNWLTFR